MFNQQDGAMLLNQKQQYCTANRIQCFCMHSGKTPHLEQKFNLVCVSSLNAEKTINRTEQYLIVWCVSIVTSLVCICTYVENI